MVAPLIINGAFYWNLDAPVGRRQPNREGDVELVRFGYLAMKLNPRTGSRISQSFQSALARMRTLGPYGEDLQAVIDEHQRHKGGTQDGIVSVAKPNAVMDTMYTMQNSWIILILTNNMRELMPDEFPRIDKHLQSGAAVSSEVKIAMTMRPV